MASLSPPAVSGNNLDRRGSDSCGHKQAASAKARFHAWCRILEAVAEMRAALDYRLYSEDPDDVGLEVDIRNWCDLTQALAGLLKAGRTG
jgi:hypothetical protein